MMANGTARDQIRGLEVLAAKLRELLKPPPESATPEMLETRRMATKGCFNLLEQATNSADPSLRVWAIYLMATLQPEAERVKYVQQLTGDAVWHNRLLGLVASAQLREDQQKALASAVVQTDSDPIVQKYASAQLELLALPKPTTMPTTTEAIPTTLPDTILLPMP
jgi:hypothetical protein